MYKDYLFSYILYIIKLTLELAKKSFCLYTGDTFIESDTNTTNVYFSIFIWGIVILSSLTGWEQVITVYLYIIMYIYSLSYLDLAQILYNICCK